MSSSVLFPSSQQSFDFTITGSSPIFVSFASCSTSLLKSFISRVIGQVSRYIPGAQVKVVVGYEAEQIKRHTAGYDLSYVVNDQFASDKNIPPVAGFDFSCNPKTWVLDDVATNVQNYLGDRLRYIQIENTQIDELEAYYKNLLITNFFPNKKVNRRSFKYCRFLKRQLTKSFV